MVDIQKRERTGARMSLTLFEWDRYVGKNMTPVDAVQNARAAGQTFSEYAEEYAGNQPSEEITNEELANGMVTNMNQAARNLATFRITGSPVLNQHSAAIFRTTPDDPDSYYYWVQTASEDEIVAKVNVEAAE
jgi:hypothetical protein